MKLNVLSLAVALGVLFGLSFLIMSLIVLWQDGGAHMYLLRRVCPGYSVSVGGSFLALVYWFVYGFIGGAVLALVYNRVGKK
jgi:hypothetical protein